MCYGLYDAAYFAEMARREAEVMAALAKRNHPMPVREMAMAHLMAMADPPEQPAEQPPAQEPTPTEQPPAQEPVEKPKEVATLRVRANDNVPYTTMARRKRAA